MDFLNDLNANQRAAVEYCDGPSLVIAGAGSGKTRVLTYKIAYLLSRGMKPWNILALTFTNKAANEMKQRIGALVGVDMARKLNMGTFHSVFSRILRVEAQLIEYEPNFTIYDEADSRSLVKAIIKEMHLDDKVYKPAMVHSRISMAKNHLIMPEVYAITQNLVERDKEQRIPAFSFIYSAYCARCKAANAMDFDDLLTNTFVLFDKYDDARLKYVDKFKYILVDEYQDTNAVQQKIVWQLSKEHLCVCAVGDDAQSIYAFRGANIDNIFDFEKQFVGTRQFKLEQNYRSTQRIVQAANSLIRHNERQIPKDVYSRNDEGENLVLKEAYSDREEALIVCNEIKRIRRNEHCEYDEFAILYRTNAQSRSFEEAMRKAGIPYKIYGGLSFYQRKEIKDVIAYFRLVVNPNDEEAFKRIINYPKRGIGDSTVAKILGLASVGETSLWHVICEPQHYGLSVSKGTMTKIDEFRQLIFNFVEKLATTDAYSIGLEIVKASGISDDIYADRLPENLSRQENLEELLGSMQEFVESRQEEGLEHEIGLADYLREVSLQTDMEGEVADDNESRVSLMTVHSAKGLEFPIVFIVGLEENIFPSLLSQGSRRELEEERRLLYVAITRAERHCILTYAKSRYRYGRMESESPSRFLRDIDPTLLKIDTSMIGSQSDIHSSFALRFSKSDRWQNSRPVATQFMADPIPRVVSHRDDTPSVETFSPSFKRMISVASVESRRRPQVSADDTGVNGLREDCIIEHERFGQGRVIRLEGSGENMKATVQFSNIGVKQLLVKFARFKVIG